MGMNNLSGEDKGLILERKVKRDEIKEIFASFGGRLRFLA